MFAVDIFGTAGPDLIEISATSSLTQIRINGGALQQTADTQINVNAGDGSDIFRVTSTRQLVSLHLNGEFGDDICENLTRDLDVAYRGPTFFHGGTGRDSFTADNTDDTTSAAVIDITGTSIVRASFGAISLYDGVEVVAYSDNNNANVISISEINSSFSSIRSMTIIGNGGNDTFTTIHSTATSGLWYQSVGDEGLTVVGGSGTDTWLLDDSDNVVGHDYTITSSRLELDGTPWSINYASIDAIDFDTRSSGLGINNTIHLDSKPAATSLSIDSDAGSDNFIVGNGDLDSNGLLASNVTLLGGTGTDTLEFDDRQDADTAGETESYTFGNLTLAKAGPTILYGGFETQQLFVANQTTVGQQRQS